MSNWTISTATPDYLSGLNEQQRAAASTIEGPVLILAGAGSGKTRVITYRIAHLIAEGNVRPENILAVTFTNKAAAEMKERVDKLLASHFDAAQRTGSPLLSTFHSLCVRMLRRDIERLGRGYTRSFTIYDTDDQQKVVRNIMKDLGYDDKAQTPRAVQSAISAAKNKGEDPKMYAARYELQDERRARIARIYARYEQKLQNSNALDFDDLLIRTVQLLRHDLDTRDYYHNRFRHVMVDEFQDTNGIQYELVRLIVEGREYGTEPLPEELWHNRSLCVVGDDGQSIYAFRGSDFKILLGYQKDFKNAKVVKLEENYRSTKHILDAANKIIANNKERIEKTLYTNSAEGAKVRYAQVYDGEGEARFVVSKIEEHQLREPNLKSAVLYRTNAQSRLFEEACRRAGLRYNLVGGFSFYDRAEVKDVISYLKLAMNPSDSIALSRIINVPARSIGKTTMDEIERRAAELGVSLWEAIAYVIDNQTLPARATTALQSFREIVTKLVGKTQTEPLSEIVKAAVIDTGYERALKLEGTEEAEARLLNLEELVNAAAEGEEQGEALRDFLDHAALVSDADQYKEEAQVTLMTIHAAKGLEFPLVFIAGLEENLFPHSRVRDNAAELEEERRLCYVAITRAEKYLYITHALKRRVYGEELPAEPSRFLMEFPIEIVEDISKGPSWLSFSYKNPTAKERNEPGELRYEYDEPPQQRRSNYQGRSYNDVDSVREFSPAKPAPPAARRLSIAAVRRLAISLVRPIRLPIVVHRRPTAAATRAANPASPSARALSTRSMGKGWSSNGKAMATMPS
ncbi:MAG: UvrD-helicase domain-containing protein [Blastocatellia bacterium]